MKYIPQGPPFEMIDQLLSVSDEQTVTDFTIRSGHLFVKDDWFTEPGLIENMAQTAAAGTGWKAMQDNTAVPVGFIGAVKDFRVSALPKVGNTIVTSVKILHQVMNAHIVQGIVTCDNIEIASAEFKIFLQ